MHFVLTMNHFCCCCLIVRCISTLDADPIFKSPSDGFATAMLSVVIMYVRYDYNNMIIMITIISMIHNHLCGVNKVKRV